MNGEKNHLFAAENIYKYFGSTIANDGVSVSIERGHIRGLIGENGSGKSTLASIISGIYIKDGGDMMMNGKAYNPQSPLDAREHKIGTVVQELGLVDGLPVGINVFLGRFQQFSRNGVINLKKLYSEAVKLFEKWGFHNINTSRMTDTLSIEEKKIVELMRALSIEPDLLILDEITQALSLKYRRILLDIIKKLKADGKSILIVTHDVEEMLEITDSITVLRDGKIIKTVMSDGTTPNDIKWLMVGRDLKSAYYRENEQESYSEQVVLNVKNLTTEYFEDVTFDLHKGQILGICGLSDAGIHELAETLFAVRKHTNGSVTVTMVNEKVKSPRQAMRLKMGFVPKDRDKQAIMINDSIENNVSMAAVEIVKGLMGFLRPQKRRKLSEQVIGQFEVKTKGRRQLLNGLSGGNKQKVNLGRWMIQDKDILILDSPTRGVDVGVKSYIYNAMLSAKKNGVSMIIVSDELPELIGMSDTLLIMKSGRIVKTLERSSGFTEEKIIEVML
jgi:ribose transport system ATP-binding protein